MEVVPCKLEAMLATECACRANRDLISSQSSFPESASYMRAPMPPGKPLMLTEFTCYC